MRISSNIVNFIKLLLHLCKELLVSVKPKNEGHRLHFEDVVSKSPRLFC